MDDVGWSLLSIGLLTAATLFFSLNNISLRTFSRYQLNEAFKKRGLEDKVEAFIERVEDFTLVCAFFRMLCNTGIIVLLLAIFKFHAYLMTFITAAVIFIFFTLAIPHSWSKYSGEAVLVRTWPLLKVFAFLAWPVLFILHLHDAVARRLAGVPEVTPEEEQEEKQEEILNFVEQGRLEGIVDEEQRDMIESVLELAETTAEEIMTPRTDMIALQADEPLDKVLEIINQAGHSRIPIYEENVDNIIGLLYAKDLLSEIGNNPETFNLREKLRPAFFVPETKPLRDLLHEFQNQKLHIAIVLDEYGGTAGIVTIEDILEELVGEITDEYEEAPEEEFKAIDENTAQVDARMYVDDLNEEFDIDLPEEEDYDTVGGFVFSHLGYIPKTGEQFEYQNLRFTIVDAEPRRVNVVRIEKQAIREEAQ